MANHRKAHPQRVRLRRHMDGPYCPICVPGRMPRLKRSARMKVDRSSWKREAA